MLNFENWLCPSLNQAQYIVCGGLSESCVTLLFFYAGNDLRTDINTRSSKHLFRPYVETIQGHYEVIDATPTGYSEWRSQISKKRYPEIAQYSYTVYTAARIWKEFINNNNKYKKRRVDTSEYLDVLKFIISNFTQILSVNGNNMVFVYIPARTYYEKLPYKEKEDIVFNKINEIVTSNMFNVVDLRNVLSAEDYFRYDGH